MITKRNILAVLILLALVGVVLASPGIEAGRASEGLELRLAKTSANTPFAEEDLAIIVNKLNPTKDLSVARLRSLILAERSHWSNGQKVTVVMRNQGAERLLVLQAVCRMSDRDFNRYLMHYTFTGQVQAGPKLLASAEGVRKFIFNVPGAIGYVRLGEVDGSVKTIRLDGRSPGEAGYTLKLASR